MKQNLNFAWKYVDNYKLEYLKSFPNDCEIVDIPHNVKDLPYNYFDEKCYQRVVTYLKEFDVEKDINDNIVILRFEAFMVKAQIYLNDNFLGEFVSAYNPIEIDVSKYVNQKENKLIVVLDGKEDENVPPFGYAVDYLTFAGIYREVSINVHPKVYIKKSLVSGDMHGNVYIKDIVSGDKYIEHKITHKVYFDDKLVKETSESSFLVDNRVTWELEEPALYTLETILESEYGVSTYKTRFGFRSVFFTKEGFYLNSKKIKLVGLNRHQSYPYVGYAMPASAQIDDANILKYEAGVNVVRTSHYPQSEHFLNRCDEIGLLVINEIPGWQHISKAEKWRNQYYENVRSMVIEEYNHPSLIAHGVRIDESQDDHELYVKGNQIAHEIDRSRPTLGVRNFKNSELLENIYAYNDFRCANMLKGLDNPKSVKTKGKPYLVTEYMGHMDPTKASDSSYQKIEHALRHALVINDNFKYENSCGAIGWCFTDYYTHADFGSGDHICPHGVFDMYRNPKYAASIYLSQQDEIPMMEVLCNMRPGDFKEATYQDIYVATNADYIELYKNGEFVNKFVPNTRKFRYLKHPLIHIDDLVGTTFKDGRFSNKDKVKMSKILSHLSFYGLQKLKLPHYLTLAKVMMKYKLKYPDLVDLYNSHCAAWGGIAKTYTFKAYKDNKVFKEVNLGPSLSFDLNVKLSKEVLENKETYDVTRIRIAYVDQYNNVMNYANKPVVINVEGPIEILGPSIESLLGGQLSIYVRSKNEVGEAKVTLICEDIVKEIQLKVK